MFKSLLTRIVSLCCATMACFILMFVTSNQYAIHQMRRQAISAQEALFQFYANQLDASYEATRLDLLRYVTSDLSLNTLCVYDTGSNGYKLSMQACKAYLTNSIEASQGLDTLFLYADNSDTLLSVSKAQSGSRYQYLLQHRGLFLNGSARSSGSAWQCLYAYGFTGANMSDFLLLLTLPASEQVTMGAVVLVSDLLEPLRNVFDYEDMLLLVYHDDGRLLTPGVLPDKTASDLSRLIADGTTESLPLVQDPETGENYVAIFQQLQFAPVYIVSLVPQREILKDLALFQDLGYYLPFALALLMVCTVAIIRRSLDKPLSELIFAMEKVARGDLSARLPKGGTTEFMRINLHFNNMVKRIDQLNRDVREQTLLTHKAELRHLQAQINPHFYQNTLNLIYNLAALQEYALIQRTALHLADYFRFIMRSGDEMIRLSDELKHISNYMELQKIRYPGGIEYRQSVEEALLDRRILPLLLQPFVENSVIHGLTTERLFVIEVHIQQAADGGLRIRIEDNGTGMSEDRILQLNRLMHDQADGGGHIGVWNVVTRLHRHYGDRAKLRFEQNTPVGSRVLLELPPEGGQE